MAITRSGLAQARACPERGRRALVLGERGEPPPPDPRLASFIAKDQLVTWAARTVLRGGTPNPSAAEAVYTQAWHRAGGQGSPGRVELLWASAWVSALPFLANAPGRRVFAVQPTLVANGYLDRCWSSRPDVLVVEPDGGVSSLQFTAASLDGLADAAKLADMAALDQLTMHYGLAPEYQGDAHPHRVLVCSVESYAETDITLDRAEARAHLAQLDAFVRQLEDGICSPAPGPDTCPGCPFARDCAVAYHAPAPTDIPVFA